MAVATGRFREDVAFRLGEVVVHLPALRERRGDIPLLAEHFNYNMCLLLKKPYAPLARGIVDRLAEQAWPGNVRELASRVREFVTTGDAAVLFDEGETAQEGRREEPGHAPVATGPASRNWRGVSLKETARQAGRGGRARLDRGSAAVYSMEQARGGQVVEDQLQFIASKNRTV